MSLWHAAAGREQRGIPIHRAILNRRQVVGAALGAMALGGRAASGAAAQATPAPAPATPAAAVRVGTFAAPGFGSVGSVNLHWVETPAGLVLIDGLRTPPDAEAAVAVLRGIAQPVLAILVTHAHPDHVGGLTTLREAFGPMPIYASQETIDILREDRGGFLELARSVPGDNYPAEITLPDHAVGDGAEIVIGGVGFAVREMGPGEAAAMTVYHVPAANARFVGDIVDNGMTPLLINERTGAWLDQLLRLATDDPDGGTIYPGHGPAGSPALLAAQAGYLTTIRELVGRRLAAADTLTPAAIEAVLGEMDALYPGYPPVATAPGIAALNVAAVANELTAAQ